MLHTDIQKQLQELSLEDTLALAQLALDQVKKKANSSDRIRKNPKKASTKMLKLLKKHSVKFPAGFKFSREEANER